MCIRDSFYTVETTGFVAARVGRIEHGVVCDAVIKRNAGAEVIPAFFSRERNTLKAPNVKDNIARRCWAHKSLEDACEQLLLDCLLYTSDAAEDQLCVDLGESRIIKKKKIDEI
eukprot:TRINITY_DN23840_c0_g1_i1.p1 TRINITY_DN23840_c0_g1~~TRINITY_DN23840_c0_g1_i1.p1  ORF type:complete len:114 (+),score=40.40 TRINITY_DN23840_c0_g1_i1:124-465(+)